MKASCFILSAAAFHFIVSSPSRSKVVGNLENAENCRLIFRIEPDLSESAENRITKVLIIKKFLRIYAR